MTTLFFASSGEHNIVQEVLLNRLVTAVTLIIILLIAWFLIKNWHRMNVWRVGVEREMRAMASFADAGLVELKETKVELGTLRQQIEYEMALFKSVAEHTSDSIVVADCDLKIIYWNRAASLLFGYEEKEMIGQLVDLLMPPAYRSLHHAGVRRWRETGVGPLLENITRVEGLRRDGTVFPIALSLSVFTVGRDEKCKEYFSAIIRKTNGEYHTDMVLPATTQPEAQPEAQAEAQPEAQTNVEVTLG